MESRYDRKAWAAATTLGRRVYNFNFRLAAVDIPGWQLLKAIPMHVDPQTVETVYVLRPKDGPPEQLIRIGTAELSSWRAAQDYLTQLLDHTMRPDLPATTNELGDVAFVAKEQPSDAPAAAQFTRGNIAITISSVGEATASPLPLAAAIDRLLSQPVALLPHLTKFASRKKPQTVLPRGKLGATLVKDLPRSTGSAWMKVTVPDGELLRKDKALVYVSGKKTKQSVQIQLIER